jgi:hypothetical protein
MHLGFYWSLSSYRSFLGVVFALLTTTSDAIPLPVRWSYLLYCLDDRALRQHIHLTLLHLFPLSISKFILVLAKLRINRIQCMFDIANSLMSIYLLYYTKDIKVLLRRAQIKEQGQKGPP